MYIVELVFDYLCMLCAGAVFVTAYAKAHDPSLAIPQHLSKMHTHMLLYLNPTGNPYWTKG